LMSGLRHLNLAIHSTPDLINMLAIAATALLHLNSMSIIFNTASPWTGHCPLYQFSLCLGTLPRFHSLKSLKLVANVHSHSDLNSCLWANVFPPMERLDLVHNCVSCQSCPRQPGALGRKAKRKVAKLVEESLFSAFK